MARKDGIRGALNVSGEGQIKVKPDVASVRLAVLTEGKTAADAASQNAELASRVVAALEKLGIAHDALQTVGLNLFPVYTSDDKTGTTRITGFRAEDSIIARTSIDLAGKAFDAGVSAGANESSGISFALSDNRPHRDKALEAAVHAALAEAELVATAMGVTIRGPKTIDIDQGAGPILVRSVFAEARASTPVLPGELTITARVRVSFEYKT